MARKRSAIDADMQQVYDMLPPMECKGLCQESCGPLEMSARERQRLAENGIKLEERHAAVKRLMEGGEYTCPALTPEGQCGVYEIRPLICRLWGMVEGMPCEFGCIPEGGRLTNAQARILIQSTINIGGEPSS